MIRDGSTADILEAAIENDSDVDTSIGFADVSGLQARREQLIGELDAQDIDADSPATTRRGLPRRM